MEKMQAKLLRLVGWTKLGKLDFWIAPGGGGGGNQAEAWAKYNERFTSKQYDSEDLYPTNAAPEGNVGYEN